MTTDADFHPGGTEALASPERVLGFARSELFERTFKEGMALVEETAAYLDGPGRAASKRLSRVAALAYAGESMRLTTRLMQVASWLLVQRAVRDGEMKLEDAANEKYRMHARSAGRDGGIAALGGAETLPEALKALAARGAAIHERVRRLDADMYGAPKVPANGVGDQLAKLEAAFGGG
jgi:regulator of CtrA degradation